MRNQSVDNLLIMDTILYLKHAEELVPYNGNEQIVRKQFQSRLRYIDPSMNLQSFLIQQQSLYQQLNNVVHIESDSQILLIIMKLFRQLRLSNKIDVGQLSVKLQLSDSNAQLERIEPSPPQNSLLLQLNKRQQSQIILTNSATELSGILANACHLREHCQQTFQAQYVAIDQIQQLFGRYCTLSREAASQRQEALLHDSVNHLRESSQELQFQNAQLSAEVKQLTQQLSAMKDRYQQQLNMLNKQVIDAKVTISTREDELDELRRQAELKEQTVQQNQRQLKKLSTEVQSLKAEIEEQQKTIQRLNKEKDELASGDQLSMYRAQLQDMNNVFVAQSATQSSEKQRQWGEINALQTEVQRLQFELSSQALQKQHLEQFGQQQTIQLNNQIKQTNRLNLQLKHCMLMYKQKFNQTPQVSQHSGFDDDLLTEEQINHQQILFDQIQEQDGKIRELNEKLILLQNANVQLEQQNAAYKSQNDVLGQQLQVQRNQLMQIQQSIQGQFDHDIQQSTVAHMEQMLGNAMQENQISSQIIQQNAVAMGQLKSQNGQLLQYLNRALSQLNRYQVVYKTDYQPQIEKLVAYIEYFQQTLRQLSEDQKLYETFITQHRDSVKELVSDLIAVKNTEPPLQHGEYGLQQKGNALQPKAAADSEEKMTVFAAHPAAVGRETPQWYAQITDIIGEIQLQNTVFQQKQDNNQTMIMNQLHTILQCINGGQVLGAQQSATREHLLTIKNYEDVINQFRAQREQIIQQLLEIVKVFKRNEDVFQQLRIEFDFLDDVYKMIKQTGRILQ